MSDERPRLEPARLEPANRKADFKPPKRWRWVGMIVLLVAGVAGTFWFRHKTQVERLRSELQQVHGEQVAPAAERIRSFTERVEQWTMAAAEEEPEPWADPELRISDLHDSRGVYMRLPADAAISPARIREAARLMERDAITRCLGIEPIPLRGLFQTMELLSPQWIERLHTEDRLMRLRVMEDQLLRHVRKDLPLLMHTVQSDYFLLVLQHGETRAEEPVDVFLWDLDRERLLLRTRVESSGVLLPVRVDIGDTGTPRRKSDLRSPGAHDCSIAAEVKALTGEPPLAAQPQTARALEGRAEAAEDDAKPSEEAEEAAHDGGRAAADAGAPP